MKRSNELLLLITFKIIYDYIYIFITTNTFDYLGSVLSFNIHRYIINWIVIVIFLVVLIYFFKDDTMSFVLKNLFVFSGIPAISLFGLKDIEPFSFFLMILYWLIMIISFKIFQKVKLKPKRKLEFKWRGNLRNLNIVFIVSSFLSVFLWGYYGSFRILTSFSDVYSYRLALREVNIPSILRYSMVWLGNVLLPYCFAMFILNKKYFRVILTFICGIMLFSINGMKSWLIIYFLIIFIFAIYKGDRKINRYTGLLALFISMFGLLAIFFVTLFDLTTLTAFFHRVFSVPAEISYNYYDFFSKNEPLLLRESILRHIIKSPYNKGSNFIIGELYSGSITINANNGMYGDAYANFKVLGIMIYPILLSLIFKIFASFSCNAETRVINSVLLILIWNLINASLFMWLVSGGVVVFIILFYIDDKSMRRVKCNSK